MKKVILLLYLQSQVTAKAAASQGHGKIPIEAQLSEITQVQTRLQVSAPKTFVGLKQVKHTCPTMTFIISG